MNPHLTALAAHTADHVSRLKQQTGFEMTPNQGSFVILAAIVAVLIFILVKGLKSSS